MEFTQIKFERSGGFANIRITAELNLRDLSDEQAIALKELLDELDFPKLPTKLTSGETVPDEFIYTITVETEKWQHTIIADGVPKDAKIQELLELLNRLARKKMRNL
ncbi:MAG: hypothetical protein HS124_05180 [Anaerolineales bacterium]|nr:hypothetical protein [Anaerolineales bacterium]MCL4260646.1 hypothetical protein [Anaerolineales bacterium]